MFSYHNNRPKLHIQYDCFKCWCLFSLSIIIFFTIYFKRRLRSPRIYGILNSCRKMIPVVCIYFFCGKDFFSNSNHYFLYFFLFPNELYKFKRKKCNDRIDSLNESNRAVCRPQWFLLKLITCNLIWPYSIDAFYILLLSISQ